MSGAGFLDGVRVLDFTQGIAGPACVRLPAAWGADVVKVERPGAGDAARHWGPVAGDAPGTERGLLFLYLNGTKRSIELDPAGVEAGPVVADLARWAGIVVESLAPAAAERLGITAEALRQINPATVLVSISSFGREGPYREFSADELTLSALGGLMYHTGAYDREPLIFGADQLQYLAGIHAAVGTAVALLAHDHDEAGERITRGVDAGERPYVSAFPKTHVDDLVQVIREYTDVGADHLVLHLPSYQYAGFTHQGLLSEQMELLAEHVLPKIDRS